MKELFILLSMVFIAELAHADVYARSKTTPTTLMTTPCLITQYGKYSEGEPCRLRTPAAPKSGCASRLQQHTSDPELAADATKVAGYARRSMPYAVALGFAAGLTANAVFNRLSGLNVVRTAGVDTGSGRS